MIEIKTDQASQQTKLMFWAVVVAQLVEWSLPSSGIHRLNPTTRQVSSKLFRSLAANFFFSKRKNSGYQKDVKNNLDKTKILRKVGQQ